MDSARSSETDPAGASRSPCLSAFDEHQRNGAYPPGVEGHYWHRSRNRIIHRALRLAGAAAPMLDIGCGPGVTVQYLNRHGLECAGTDLARYDIVERDLACDIRYDQDAFALPATERERFRTLLLLDVLEHLPEPGAFLAHCVEAFPRAAHLVITVPARQELFSNFDTFYGHVRRYDRAMAAAVCREAGLGVLRCEYFFHAFYPAMALQRLCHIDRSVEVAPVRRQWWHRALAALLYRDATWLPAALPGASLLLVARPASPGRTAGDTETR